MLGNDIVDLEDPDADATTFSPRWSQRVFTPRELDAVTNAADPVRARWRFWAAKEAAYKCARQAHDRAIFSPRAFEVRFGSLPAGRRRGWVEWRGERLSLHLEEGASWVHAWVDDGTDAAGPPRRGIAVLPTGLRQLAEGASDFVRRCVLRDAITGPLRDAVDLEIVRRDRVPHLQSARGRESASLSLSHHGRYVAWAWRPAHARASSCSNRLPSNESMNGACA